MPIAGRNARRFFLRHIILEILETSCVMNHVMCG
jgi:hypothetical protein